MRIRIALTLGALVLAGGALTGGIAMAQTARSAPSPTATTAPTAEPTTRTRPAPPVTQAPVPVTSRAKAVPAPARPGSVRVPRAVPAGPTGDLHLPAIGETR